jgi:hypothetical protein
MVSASRPGRPAMGWEADGALLNEFFPPSATPGSWYVPGVGLVDDHGRVTWRDHDEVWHRHFMKAIARAPGTCFQFNFERLNWRSSLPVRSRSTMDGCRTLRKPNNV